MLTKPHETCWSFGAKTFVMTVYLVLPWDSRQICNELILSMHRKVGQFYGSHGCSLFWHVHLRDYVNIVDNDDNYDNNYDDNGLLDDNTILQCAHWTAMEMESLTLHALTVNATMGIQIWPARAASVITYGASVQPYLDTLIHNGSSILRLDV